MSEVTNSGGAPESSAQRNEVVGGALHDDAAETVSAEPTQDEPVLAQNHASTGEKLDGIAAQTRVDLGEESQERYEEVLRQRLSDSGIALTDDEVSDLARRSASGSGTGAA